MRRSVLRRLGHLLALTGDAERNAADKRFVEPTEPAGRIFYVYDTNVFELFVNPTEHASYCENFYAHRWGAHPAGRKYSAQAGLLAAEYLFSGQLPGLDEDDPIYVTQWHYQEITSRFRKMAFALRESKETLTEAAKNQNEEHVERMLRLGGNLSEFMSEAPADLARDVEDYMAQGNGSEEAARRFVLARTLAAHFAEDKVFEPMEQIVRVYREIFPRLRPLNNAFPLLTEQDNREFEDYRSKWVIRLSNSNKGRKRGKDDRHGAVEFDGRSIAYIQWIVEKQLSFDQKVVFVTGDAALTDVYREWYHSERNAAPYWLRSVNQFSPLLNPRDMPNDLVVPGKLSVKIFENVRAAIESPLLTFNIKFKEQQQKNEAGREQIHEASREIMASVMLRDHAPETHPIINFYTHRTDENWWQQRDRVFQSLRDKWRTAERVAIGVSLPLLQRRMAQLQSFLAWMSSNGSETAGEYFVRYLHRILDNITFESLQRELPDALALVRNWARREDKSVARAPLDLRLDVPVIREKTVEYEPFNALLQSALKSKSSPTELDPGANAALASRLDILFAVASALAIKRHLWLDAERLAENAMAAFAALPQSEPINNRLGLEYEYLLAVSRRFAFGNYKPFQREREAQAEYARTVRSLNKLVIEHKGRNEPELVIRAFSELVANRLFYCTWLLSSFSEQGHFGGGRSVLEESLLQAKADIKAASELAPSSSLETPTGTALAINSAALALLSIIAFREGKVSTKLFDDHELDVIGLCVDLILPRMHEFPAIVRMDLYGFLAMFRSEKDFGDQARAALKNPALDDLAIDMALRDLVEAQLRPRASHVKPPRRPQRSRRRVAAKSTAK